MHFNTVNKWLKDVRIMQRQMQDLTEVTSRQEKKVAAQAAVVREQLDVLIDELLKVTYEH